MSGRRRLRGAGGGLALIVAMAVAGPQGITPPTLATVAWGATIPMAQAPDSVPPPTVQQQLVTPSADEPEPSPALWVGLVVGFGGLVGLTLSRIGREHDRGV